MKIIKNSEELKKLVDENKDLFLKNEDLCIKFEPTRKEIRDVYCNALFLMNDNQRFNFNGWNFTGGDFNGGDFNGGDFNGRDFNGGDFNGGDFNGWDFNGKKVSYHAFFNCYGKIKCESIEGRRSPHSEPICLDGKLEIIKPEEVGKKVKIRLANDQIFEGYLEE